MKNKAEISRVLVKKMNKIGVFVLFAVSFLGLSTSKAFAMTPTLNLYSSGNNYVQITVDGDAYSSVNLYYYSNGIGSVLSSNLGSTNSSGYFSTAISNNTYNINQNSSVYVMVDGYQSNSVSWPYNNNNSGNGNIYLNQSSVYLNSGQTVTDYINGGGGSYYVSSNSNPGVASISLSGNQINVYGNYSGTTNVSICSNSSGYGCVTLFVSVNGNNNYNQYSPVTLSQNNISVGVGQTVSVGVSGGTGIYYISSNNSNQYAASAYMNNGNISVYGRYVGSETVTICSSVVNNYNNSNQGNGYSYNSCADLIINVGQNYSYNNNYLNGGGLTSGVFLSQVPYTGAGPNSGVTLFVLGLWIWSAAITYFVFKKMNKNSHVQLAHSSNTHRDLIAKFKQENLMRRGK